MSIYCLNMYMHVIKVILFLISTKKNTSTDEQIHTFTFVHQHSQTARVRV